MLMVNNLVTVGLIDVQSSQPTTNMPFGGVFPAPDTSVVFFPTDGAQTFFLPDKSLYKVMIKNLQNRAMNASVEIDAVNIGLFRLRPNGTIKLERSVKTAKKFMFVELGERSPLLGPDPGTLQITLFAEPPPSYFSIEPEYETDGVGATVMVETSDQKFVPCAPIHTVFAGKGCFFMKPPSGYHKLV